MWVIKCVKHTWRTRTVTKGVFTIRKRVCTINIDDASEFQFCAQQLFDNWCSKNNVQAHTQEENLEIAFKAKWWVGERNNQQDAFSHFKNQCRRDMMWTRPFNFLVVNNLLSEYFYSHWISVGFIGKKCLLIIKSWIYFAGTFFLRKNWAMWHC